MRNFSLPFHVSVEKRIHHDGASSIGEQLAAKSYQAAAGDTKLNAHPSITVIVHVDNLTFSPTELLHHHPNKGLRHIYRQVLHRFHQLSIHALGNDLRFAYHQFVTLAAHHLDKNRELQLTASHHLEGIRAAGFLYPQRYVGQQLFVEAFAQIARRHIRAFPSRKWRSIHRKLHGDGRLVDGNVRQRRRIFCAGNRLSDSDALHSSHSHDVA